MTTHFKRALLHVTHTHVLATLFALAAVLEVIALAITAVHGDPVGPIDAAWAALIGGGVVWSYLAVTGRLKDV